MFNYVSIINSVRFNSAHGILCNSESFSVATRCSSYFQLITSKENSVGSCQEGQAVVFFLQLTLFT